MKNVLAAFTLALVSFSASAHIEPGDYNGTDSSGAACSLKAIEQFFEKDLHHPLAERIRVSVGGQEFLVRHPETIVRETSEVKFNHDVFEGVVPNEKGALALVIDMDHQAGGPKGYQLITHDWVAKTMSSVNCSGLTLR